MHYKDPWAFSYHFACCTDELNKWNKREQKTPVSKCEGSAGALSSAAPKGVGV